MQVLCEDASHGAIFAGHASRFQAAKEAPVRRTPQETARPVTEAYASAGSDDPEPRWRCTAYKHTEAAVAATLVVPKTAMTRKR